MTISFTIPGRLKGKVHHRSRALTVAGRTFVQTYKDPSTRNAMAVVAHYASQAMTGLKPLEGPLAILVQVYVQPPASWSKKRQNAAQWVTGKPDCDNALKLLCDALNGVVYRDDSQISEVVFHRRYSLREPEHVEVNVTELSQEKDAA